MTNHSPAGQATDSRSDSFPSSLWTGQLLARCPAQHAVDHDINGEAKPFVDISSDQLSGVGSN